MDKFSKIYIAGHSGMVGSAILKLFNSKGYSNIILRSSKELDLKNQLSVIDFFEINKPECVIFSAAKVGGIQANIDNPAIFLYENLIMQLNVINAAYNSGVKKFVFLGSSCIYPTECPQPMKEEYLFKGKLEPTNEGYAIAKIAGIKMLEYYKRQYAFKSISIIPCNLYGPNDSFDVNHAHVLSSLVRKFIDAKDANEKKITLWGTGIARREFMHVEDVAKGVLFMLENYDEYEYINMGWGTDISIKELAEMIAKKINFRGKIIWDITKPNGMLRKCMDVTNMKEIGFSPEITLSSGIDEMISIYKNIKTSIK